MIRNKVSKTLEKGIRLSTVKLAASDTSGSAEWYDFKLKVRPEVTEVKTKIDF